VGALIGARVTDGVQAAAHIRPNGLNAQAFTAVKWAAVGGGAVAGAAGVATFEVRTAVLGTGLAGTVAAGALSGAAAGQAARATENALSGREAIIGLGRPADIVRDAATAAVLTSAAYGLTYLRHATPKTLLAQRCDIELPPQITTAFSE
jgi:hypothetical protein